MPPRQWHSLEKLSGAEKERAVGFLGLFDTNLRAIFDDCVVRLLKLATTGPKNPVRRLFDAIDRTIGEEGDAAAAAQHAAPLRHGLQAGSTSEEIEELVRARTPTVVCRTLTRAPPPSVWCTARALLHPARAARPAAA